MPGRMLRVVTASMVGAWAIIGGHALVYTLGPTGHELTDALAEAGHGHWPLPWVASSLLAVVGVCAYGFVRDRRHGESSWSWLWPRLAFGQVAGFLLLEAGERTAVGVGAVHLLAEPVIVAGIAVQVAAACLASALLRTSARIAGWLAHRQHAVPFSVGAAGPACPAVTIPLSARPDRVGLTRRGPPLGLLT